ncbi:carbamoyltransferase HypF [Clostridium sp. CX1]|uniref:carbamoyltransferase HypF n=1 Tax=Clostridium sp. CX1 TaxID=2978346 RepID=UPI0021BEA77B|nr:carbamoyltransferase HypF [Clostridium sp. CX1]MCT8976687.1 carbamoyltransferase HypF [Clostridium sp. CX1]
MKRIFIKVEGIVQGVGFRPFVYNLAVSLDIKGWVNNNSEGVYIELQGEERALEQFLYKLKNNPPPLSKIEDINIEERELANYSDFIIKDSEERSEKITLISPDMATCDQCIADIGSISNKRYQYAFTNCTNCGPRFSIIKSIPYDRDKTTMKKFEMCSNCLEEYTDPTNRRFHAQPNGCENCGPHIWVEDADGKNQITENVIEFTKGQLKEGKIFAVKGLGGFHLVCDGTNEKAIELLRLRKNRPHKPLAVMIRDIESIRKYCTVNWEEEKILTGSRKPIVVLDQIADYNLPDNIAPNQKTLGVMLPYTPLHYLLFSRDIEVLIMTSANIHGLPIEYINESAREKLKGIVDYFLLHNRDIYVPVDDSVVKVVSGESRMMRRARGYAPEPIKMNCKNGILACGSNMKNTFCITKENFLFLSQHNGDLENLETYEHYKRNIEHFENIFDFSPRYIACDMHPSYSSSVYANSIDLPKVHVQHHHAHIVSCLVENKVENKVIGVAYDGTGYGTDGKVWGGEFLICNSKEFDRVGHLEYSKMPGGDKAIKEPWRMAVAHIYNAFKDKEANSTNTILAESEVIDSNSIQKDNYEAVLYKLWGKDCHNILAILNANISCPETSSMGRLFDAVSSIIGVRDIISYEGQASIELEAEIEIDCKDEYPYTIIKSRCSIVEVKDTIKAVLLDRLTGVSKGKMAAKFHNTIISFTCKMCEIIREQSNIREVALSGGVFQNSYLLSKLIDKLDKSGFIVYTNKSIPCNDGGVSIGQIAIANKLIQEIS